MTDFSGTFRLLDGSGQELESAEATLAVVDPGALKVDPRNQPSLRVDWADVDAFEVGDYVFGLKLASGETVEVSKVGKRTRELTDEIVASLRAFQAKNLLLEEPVGGEAFACELTRDGASCDAQARVFATSLAVVPRNATPFNVPFGELASFAFDEGSYAVKVAWAGGELTLAKLGKQTRAFLQLLEQRVAELRRRGLEALTALLPQVPSMAMRRLGAAMADGVPARREQLDAISPEIWPALVKAAAGTDELRKTLEELSALCPADEVAVAIKETNQRQDADEEPPTAEEQADGEAEPDEAPPVPEQMEGRVVWFAFPIVNEDRSKPGNAVAVEAVTRSGRATYLFRIAPAQVYQDASWEELRQLARDRVRSVSRAMVALSFKREPIYLSSEKLNSAAYARYRLALRLSAPLKASRSTFLGRAIHGKGWKKQIDNALAKART
jgi:hypothetical protein